jgi:large-conductance mechanosensitive channel
VADLAVGVIIGAAVSAIVNSLVGEILADGLQNGCRDVTRAGDLRGSGLPSKAVEVVPG